ncbi:MAG: hypothetical protein H7X86_14440 [Gorillibacterium sp.]|nr:hypothetical protein [Gorillibacterium sp.]
MENIKSWSTWDVECLNAVMKVPEMAEVRLGFYDRHFKIYKDQMLWKYVTRFGERSVDGTYFDLDLKVGEVTFQIEFAAEEDQFVYKLTPDRVSDTLKVHVAGMFRWNGQGSIHCLENQLSLTTQDQSFEITVSGELDTETLVNTSNQGILVSCKDSIYVRCNNRMDVPSMDQFLAKKRQGWLVQSITGGGILEDAPQAIVKGMNWNTIYDPTKKRFCTPVTREWCVMSNMTHFGVYVLFSWDTFLGSLLAALQSKELAYRQIYSVLEEMQDGFAPQYGSQVLTRWDRSNPPVGSYCILKVYQQFQEVEMLEQVFDKMYSWNRWWMNNRDGNGDGLLEWGSNRTYVDNAAVVLQESFEVAAKMESGLDNSPIYDGVRYNPQGRTLELADVGLNSLYAMDCLALVEIARELGKNDEAALLTLEYARMKEAMNSQLWNEEKGIYCNKHWSGEWSEVLTPANFYPLIAGIATKEQAARMIEEHLLNEEEFWGDYVLPGVMKSHPSFQDNDYWRGRVWGPMNYIVYEGLKKYGYEDIAHELADKSLRMFLKEWREENHIHENYNALTGDGDDVENADPVYTWGGLLPYMYTLEVMEALPKGAIRFGNISEQSASLSGIVIGNHTYSIIKDKGLQVLRDGQPYLTTDISTVKVTVNKEENGVLSVSVVRGDKVDGTLSIYADPAVREIVLAYEGKQTTMAPGIGGLAVFHLLPNGLDS